MLVALSTPRRSNMLGVNLPFVPRDIGDDEILLFDGSSRDLGEWQRMNCG
jgi:hypothetical protein